MAESRVEDLLETGVEQPVLPMSEIEAILRGEPVTPHSRIAELLLKYNPSDILIEKRITENGTYFATNDNADGYYKVVVDEYVPTLILKEVTANGTYDPAVDGADGYSSIRVNLPLEHQIGEVFNQNGLYHVTPSQGYEGISRADIMVQVNPVLEAKTIDANGTYTPSQGYDGFSEVTVDVPGQNADLALRCVGLDGYSVTITSADNSETYTKSVTGSPATITFDNLAYVGNWTVSNTKDSTTVTVSNAVSNEDYKLYTQQIPRMTAYDQPSGVISASSEYDERFLAWFAAANNGGSGGNGWMGASMNSYLIYQFATPVIFSKLYFRIADVWGFNYYNIQEYGNDIDVLGSVDGTTYERCTSTGSTVNKKGYGDVNIDLNGKKYKYLKVIVPKATFSRDYYNCGVMNLMLYSDPEATAYMLGPKSITANGTYNPASDGLDAFDEVTVNVPNSLKGALERTVSVIDDSVLESIGAYAFYNYTKLLSSSENLTSVKFRNVTIINNSAFSGCTYLTNADFPSATSIESGAFQNCSSLTDIDFPNVTRIVNDVFQNCTSLTAINFPNATNVGSGAFRNCASLTDIDFPNVTRIGGSAFYYCSSLTDIDFPNVTRIEDGAFYGCTSLADVNFHNATYVGGNVFRNCTSLTAINFPNATNTGGTYAFYGCTSLTDIDFPNATSIGQGAFQNCTSLTDINCPNATSIGSDAFRSCSSLTEIEFAKVTTISAYAFNGCTSLDTLILRKSDGTTSLTNINAFNNTPFASGGTGGTLYVPQALISSYQSASDWSTILGYPNNQIKPIEGSIYE